MQWSWGAEFMRSEMDSNKKYVSDVPELLEEWDYNKNKDMGLNPETITYKSNKKVWWHCGLNHSWQEKVSNRSNGRGCPFCSGHRVWRGFNDLVTTNPDISSEWDYKSNGDRLPTEFSRGSSYNAWWKCSRGHIYQTKISNRTILKRGCPYCAGRYAIKGKNDLVTVNPILSKQWDYEKNKLSPSDYLPGSNKKVWWKCEKEHSWAATICSRNNGNGCPICAHQRVNIDNCLAIFNPTLAKQWHPSKNGLLTPFDVLPKSNRKVWWVCEKGHEFQASINNRSRKSILSCPICNLELKTSFPEQAIYFYIQKEYANAINRYKDDGYELDVFIPEIKVGIEYDGMLYHTEKTTEKEEEKNCYFKNKGIRLIRVKEYSGNVPKLDNDCIVWHRISSTYKFLNDAILRLFKLIPNLSEIDVDVHRDDGAISSLFLSNEKENSVANKYPQLLKEWDYEKNGGLKPEYVSCKSTKKRWWRCEKKHSFNMSPSKRTERGQGCPFCSGRYASENNNLLLKKPLLCLEWDEDKNGGKRPENFTPVSGQKVWWKCNECGYEWEASISNRVKGSNCPSCGDKNRRKSFNSTIVKKNGSFGKSFPKLLIDWDYEKNNIDPENIPRFSERKVWWKCHLCGNEWSATLHSSALRHMCPICSKNKKKKHHSKSVCQYSLKGSFIEKFSSVTDAKEKTGARSIIACCKHKCKSSGGYIWRYADEADE